jgi:FkbM family methyltransferase
MLHRFRTLIGRMGVVGAAMYLIARIVRGLCLPSARWSWAQFGEDLVARDILGLEKGYYVDVGCNHPVRWSNTYLFYLHGWNGLLLDGNAGLIQKCCRRRPADTAVCCLLGDKPGEGEIAIYDEHALSSAVPSHNAERRGSAKLLETRRVAIRTLTDVLAEASAPPEIDFLTIDVEGMDLLVLRGLDFDRFRPRLIAIEDAAFRPMTPDRSEVVQFLIDHEYVLYSHVHPTLFFVHKDVKSRSFHGPTPGDA